MQKHQQRQKIGEGKNAQVFNVCYNGNCNFGFKKSFF